MKVDSIFAALLLTFAASAQSLPSFPTAINSQRPLDKAADILVHMFGKVVSYEETVPVWDGDLLPSASSEYKFMILKYINLEMPRDLNVGSDTASNLEKIVAAYNQQPIGPRFKVLTSRWGFHIVPVKSHDENGILVDTFSPLDSIIYIPSEVRTPFQHFEEIAAAASKASGIELQPAVIRATAFGNEFRAPDDKLVWGASGISAREALIDLFEKSATTFNWQLRCAADISRKGGFCFFSLSMLEVSVTDAEGKPTNRVLFFDRCTVDCPPPITPPSPTRSKSR